jgi:peptide/nickel transport system permease protein
MKFDFGSSWSHKEPVTSLILDHISPTLQINILTILVIYVVSIPLGVGQAVRRGKLFDRGTTVITFLLYAAPLYWIGPMLIIYFCSIEHFAWFPPGEMNQQFSEQLAFFPWLKDRLHHLVLPVACASYGGFAYLSKQARSGLLENLQADYVRTARAKGVSYPAAVIKHALRNSLIPIVTIAATLLPALIGGSVILETIFSIRGMGYLSFNAILQRDYPVIMATTTFAAILTLIGLLLQDILYAWLDPRVSYE